MALAARLAARRPYYRWCMVGVLFMSSFLASSRKTFGPGISLRPVAQELQWR